jgi:hypothetical protein
MGQAKQRKTAAEALRANLTGVSNAPDIKRARVEGKKMLTHLIAPHEVELTMKALELESNEGNIKTFVVPVTPGQTEGYITYVIEKSMATIDMKSDLFTVLIVVNCRNGEKQKAEVEARLASYRMNAVDRSGEDDPMSALISPLDLSYPKQINRDGTRKMSATIPHHQTVITGEELMEHLAHVRPEHHTDSNLKFHRYHLHDHAEAIRLCKALCDAGGFGTVVLPQSVRIMRYWQKLAETLLVDFETGPVTLGENDAPYNTPHIEYRIDGIEPEDENPRTMKAGSDGDNTPHLD